MPKTSKTKCTADEIADMASRGEDVSAYFSNKFTVVGGARAGTARRASGAAAGEEEDWLGRDSIP